MKGIVFVEFLELVESKFSLEMVDQIINASDLPSKGVYTAVGYYDHSEMISLVSALSEKSGVAVPELLRLYGNHLFKRFYQLFPIYFEGSNNAFEFLEKVDNYIHVEVLKLYPDANLPKFTVISSSDNEIVMDYESPRHLEDLAHGLIEECCRHYDMSVDIDIKSSGPDISRFTVSLNN